MHETTTLLFVTLPSIHRFETFFTPTLINKPFLIWLLTSPNLQYVATLPYLVIYRNACLADITVSQGSVATYTMCGGILVFI